MDIDKEMRCFCDNIKNIITEYDLSDQDIMEIMHIGKKNLEYIKNGIFPKRMRLNSIFLLADHLKIKADDIFR